MHAVRGGTAKIHMVCKHFFCMAGSICHATMKKATVKGRTHPHTATVFVTLRGYGRSSGQVHFFIFFSTVTFFIVSCHLQAVPRLIFYPTGLKSRTSKKSTCTFCTAVSTFHRGGGRLCKSCFVALSPLHPSPDPRAGVKGVPLAFYYFCEPRIWVVIYQFFYAPCGSS